MSSKLFQVVSLNLAAKKGVSKKPVERITVKENYGILGDAHAGNWHRQVSLLAMEDIALMQKKLASLQPGDFAENITTRGIHLAALPLGTKINIDAVQLEVTQIGKTCHQGCEIFQQVGDCIMPRRGIFTRVIKGGEITNESIGTYDI